MKVLVQQESKDLKTVSALSTASKLSAVSSSGGVVVRTPAQRAKFVGEVIASLLAGWALMVAFFIALYYIAFAIRGSNFMTLSRDHYWGAFGRAHMPASLGALQAHPGVQLNYPAGCDLAGAASGAACAASSSAGVLSMFPWVADKLGGKGSALPGCAKAAPGLGYYFDPRPAESCANAVPATLVGKLKKEAAPLAAGGTLG